MLNFGKYLAETDLNIKHGEQYYAIVRDNTAIFPSKPVAFVHTNPDCTNCIHVRPYDENEWDFNNNEWQPEKELLNKEQPKNIRSVHICPKCGNTRFETTATVSQDWLVDHDGNFIEERNSCSQVIHGPDNDNIWTCDRCGEQAAIIDVPANKQFDCVPHSETYETVIRFTDINVDGCGTNVSVIAIVNGPDICDGVADEITLAIVKCKEKNS